MILVTVGSTMPFDELIAEVDRLAGAGVFGEKVLCQSGQSTYRMQHAEQFMARPGLGDLIAEASLVITHGGATVIEVLLAGVPFVAFANPRGAGDHQRGFLTQVARLCDISWSADVRDLERLVAERRQRGPAVINAGIPHASTLIRDMML